jgi:hypothetical protein
LDNNNITKFIVETEKHKHIVLNKDLILFCDIIRTRLDSDSNSNKDYLYEIYSKDKNTAVDL